MMGRQPASFAAPAAEDDFAPAVKLTEDVVKTSAIGYELAD